MNDEDFQFGPLLDVFHANIGKNEVINIFSVILKFGFFHYYNGIFSIFEIRVSIDFNYFS